MYLDLYAVQASNAVRYKPAICWQHTNEESIGLIGTNCRTIRVELGLGLVRQFPRSTRVKARVIAWLGLGDS